MCKSTPEEEWSGVGVAQWKGELLALEQCPHCMSYRAVMLDVDTIPVVEKEVQSDHTPVTTQEESTEDVDDEGGSWLVK